MISTTAYKKKFKQITTNLDCLHYMPTFDFANISFTFHLDSKQQFLARKQIIQCEFRNKVGLIVDKPRTSGSGSSKDENTARRFFNEA